jgi:hypothetical protein
MLYLVENFHFITSWVSIFLSFNQSLCWSFNCNNVFQCYSTTSGSVVTDFLQWSICSRDSKLVSKFPYLFGILEMVIRYDHIEQGHLSIRLLWLQLHWKPLKASYKFWRRSLQLPDMQLSSLELWDIAGSEVNEWVCIVMSPERPFSNQTYSMECTLSCLAIQSWMIRSSFEEHYDLVLSSLGIQAVHSLCSGLL